MDQCQNRSSLASCLSPSLSLLPTLCLLLVPTTIHVSVKQSRNEFGMMCCEKGDTFVEHGVHGKEGAYV